LQALQALELTAVRRRDDQAAMPEVEHAQHFETNLLSAFFNAVPFFLYDIESDDAEIADVVSDKAGDIIVADEQQIDRHVFPETEELIPALGELDAATLE
jgi:hypothetical protein